MKLKDLTEGRVHRDDPAMDDVYDNRRIDDRNKAEGPYYVYWSGQSHEWYGDDDPSSGQGRYKQKGDGGRIVAINVPTHSQASRLAQELNAAYESGDFPDKNVYNEWGTDHSLVEYGGARLNSMAKMDDSHKRDVQYSRPKDYSK